MPHFAPRLSSTTFYRSSLRDDTIKRYTLCGAPHNRKNWLFVGSVAAGERAADFLTLVSSAVRNDLDVWAYVKDVLDQLLAGTTDYASLRPDVWCQARPDFVRQYRVQERRDRADRKQRRRANRRRPSR